MMSLLAPLPHPLLDPLHIIDPWLLRLVLMAIALAVLVFVAVVVFSLVLLKRWLNRSQPVRLISRRGPAIEDQLNDIYTFFNRSETFREGCHRISASMKTFLEMKTGREVEEMTVAEIHAHLRNEEVARYFSDLARIQFDPAEPNGADFQRVFNDSTRLARRLKEGRTHVG